MSLPPHSAGGSALKLFISQSAILWAAQMGGILLTVVATIFMTRALGPEGRGIYTWLLTLAGTGSTAAMFGLDISNRRFAASHPHQIPALVRLNFWVIGIWGSLVACILAMVAWYQPASGQMPLAIMLAMATIPLAGVSVALAAVTIAEHRIWTGALMNIAPKLCMLILVAGLLFLGWTTATSALLANFLAVAAGAVTAIWLMREYLRKPGHLQPLPYLKSVWATHSASYGAGLGMFLMQKVDVLLVGVLMGHAATGYYGVASSMVDIMITPVGVIAGLLATRVAGGQAGGVSRQVVAFSMGLTVAGSTFTFFIAPWLIPFMFGAEFKPSVVLLQWLCPAVVALAFFMLMQNALTSLGRARHMALPPLLGAVSNIVLNFVLIPSHGLVGACWASIIAYALAGVAAAGLLRHTLQSR